MHFFGSPGPPKKSIVANLAPKMTPKWRSKWSQLQDCGPSPNMRLHGPIAYWTPLWGAIFPPLLRGHPKIHVQLIVGGPPNRIFQKGTVKKNDQKGAPNGLLLSTFLAPKSDILGALGPLGPRGTEVDPKWPQNDSKWAQNDFKIDTFGIDF